MAKRSTKAMIAELNALHEKIGLKLTLEIAEDCDVICLGAGWYTDFPTSKLADAPRSRGAQHSRHISRRCTSRGPNSRAACAALKTVFPTEPTTAQFTKEVVTMKRKAKMINNNFLGHGLPFAVERVRQDFDINIYNLVDTRTGEIVQRNIDLNETLGHACRLTAAFVNMGITQHIALSRRA